MKKYRCPNCKEVFVGSQEVCPKCGVKLRYADKSSGENKVEEATTISNFSFNDPEVIKHEEKFVPVTSIENLDNKNEEVTSEDAVSAPLGMPVIPQHSIIVNGESFFDGKMLPRVGMHLLAFLLFLITATIAFPWIVCMLTRWETKHTIIQGHRLKFDGKGIQLFGRYLLWLLLTALTLGIILLWVQIFLKKWKIKHTVFAD